MWIFKGRNICRGKIRIWNNSKALTTFRVDLTGEKSRDKNILMSQNERHNMKEGVCRLLLDTASQGSKWTMILSWGRGGGASLSRGLRCEFSPVLFFLHAWMSAKEEGMVLSVLPSHSRLLVTAPSPPPPPGGKWIMKWQDDLVLSTELIM